MSRLSIIPLLLLLGSVCSADKTDTKQSAEPTSAKTKTISERTVYTSSPADIISLFDELGYTKKAWQQGIREIPRVFLTNIPKRWKKESDHIPVAEKKEIFFRLLGPAILRSNELITAEREGLKKLSNKYPQLTSKEKQFVTALATKYKLLKKGKESVGVSRQYAGVIGKVDNCQVGVYASLVNTTYASIINERLFLPKSWTNNQVRCVKADVPKEFQQYKTKPELALDMIKEDIERGVKFDWIGGDGLYGHNSELCKGIDKLDKFFVMDVHRDERVFISKPSFSIPLKTKRKGRKPTKLKADLQDIRLDELCKSLTVKQWKLENIRDAAKGKIQLYVYKTCVWTWDSKSEKATRRTLIITKTNETKPKIKYSFSNGQLNQYTHQEYGYFVAQRYWVERTFDDAKNELGMSGYQARKWKSWHHHHSLVMLTALFIMKQRLDNKDQVPLLSFRDTRLLLIMQIFDVDIKEILQIKKNHTKLR